jgi:hypothetical protein
MGLFLPLMDDFHSALACMSECTLNTGDLALTNMRDKTGANNG